MRTSRRSLVAVLIALLCSSSAAQSDTAPTKPAPAPPPAAPAKSAAPPKPLPGDAKVRPAIENGLVWLCRHQDEDGAWRAQAFGAHCDQGASCADKEEKTDGYDPGITALAVLALLGSGTTPTAPIVVHGSKPDDSYDTWAAAQRGIAWLMSRQQKNGSFGGMQTMYSECLGAIALCDGYRIGKNWDWRQAGQKAVDYLEASQASNPRGKGLWGWRYAPKEQPSDTSVTGWVVRAFAAADRAGIRVPKAAITGAQDYIVWVTGDWGLVGYMDPEQAGQKVTGHNDEFDYHAGTMTALGIQVRLRADEKPDKVNSGWIKLAVEQVLLKDLPSAKARLGVDYYYWHQAMDAWALIAACGMKPVAQSGLAWRTALVDALTTLQSPASEKCSSGGWLQQDRWGYAGGTVYTTAINVLTLEQAAGG